MKTKLQIVLVPATAALLMAANLNAQQPAPASAAPPPTPPAPAPAPVSVTAPTPPAPPPIPPTWAQGRTAAQEAANLSPHPPGMSSLAPNEIPLDKIKLPPGFEISLYASGIPNARSMVFGTNGTLFVGTRFVGSVYAIVERDGKRETKVIAKGLHRPNGVAFKNGSLYVAELSRILRYDNIEANLDNPPKPVVVFDALPKDEPHGWKFMTLGPDGWLYFQIGSPGNIVIPPVTHAQIVRVDPDKGVLETVAAGVRNSVGMAFHPITKELWFTNNARDWVNDDLPNDPRPPTPPLLARRHLSSLAAQTPLYIYYQLLQFREGRRVNAEMSPHAAKLPPPPGGGGVPPFFSVQKSRGSDIKIDDVKVEAGKAIATRNHCGSCHLPNYAGQNHIPRVAGLQVDYLITQLRGFKSGARPDIDGTMASAAQPLSEQDIVDMAGYLASLK
ncbi:MAG: c-type cytochrome [Betaproteobacteria bacterium]|nr:c-type cytochrome [Betaproteobacteria bacterium]